jgi:hypothetical protein
LTTIRSRRLKNLSWLSRIVGEALWFLGVLATIKASSETTKGRSAIASEYGIDILGPPRHPHRKSAQSTRSAFVPVPGTLRHSSERTTARPAVTPSCNHPPDGRPPVPVRTASERTTLRFVLTETDS